MRVLLVGASGFVGSRILEDLLAAGHQVVAVVHSDRSRKEIESRHPGTPAMIADVGDLASVRRIYPRGTEAVLYLPGLLREFPSRGITFDAVHVGGVRNLLTVAAESGTTVRWLQMSALGTREDATTGYFRTKWQAEQLVRASNTEWTIFRPSVIFDDRSADRHNFVGELAAVARQAPVLPIIGDGRYRLQPVSLDDVSQSFVQALSKPETVHETYDMGGPEQLSYIEIIDRIALAMGKRKLHIHIPFALMEPVAALLERFAFFPITTGQLAMLKEENIIRDPEHANAWQAAFTLPMKRFVVAV